jgi:CDP-diglyceride synthetase
MLELIECNHWIIIITIKSLIILIPEFWTKTNNVLHDESFFIHDNVNVNWLLVLLFMILSEKNGIIILSTGSFSKLALNQLSINLWTRLDILSNMRQDKYPILFNFYCFKVEAQDVQAGELAFSSNYQQ